MIIIAKILSILLGIIAISKTYLDYKKRNTGLFNLLFWTVAWLLIILLSVYPVIIENISAKIGDNNSGVTAFLALSFVFLFFVVFRLYTKVDSLEQKLRDLIVKLVIKDIDEK